MLTNSRPDVAFSGSDGRSRVLNLGSGPKSDLKLHPAFRRPTWAEIRLDIDPSVKPDILGSVTDMGVIESGSVDAIWSSHNIEHLHTYEVVPALRECRRVLKPTGLALITCPDLEAVATLVVQGQLEVPAYVSPAGPVTPLDMLFGHSRSIERGSTYMAHNTGFTAKRLSNVLLQAGFAEVRIAKGRSLDLWALALMQQADYGGLVDLFGGTDQLTLLQAAPARVGQAEPQRLAR